MKVTSTITVATYTLELSQEEFEMLQYLTEHDIIIPEALTTHYGEDSLDYTEEALSGFMMDLNACLANSK